MGIRIKKTEWIDFHAQKAALLKELEKCKSKEDVKEAVRKTTQISIRGI